MTEATLDHNEITSITKTTEHTTLVDSFSSAEQAEKRSSLGETEVDLTDDESEDHYDVSQVPSTPTPRGPRKSLLAPPSTEMVNRYKDMVRSKSLYTNLESSENGCGRPDDFYGDTEVQELPSPTSLKAPLSAPPSLTNHKREALRKQFQGKDRPDAFIGSPMGTRKSYTIKTKATTTLAPPPPLSSSPPQPAVDRRAGMQKASSARLSVPDASDPSVQRFKAMVRSKAFSSSRDFYGTTGKDTEVLPPTMAERKTIAVKPKKAAHKWGAPDPENDMQARPTDFLGSPSTKRRSYKIKGETTTNAMASPVSVLSPSAGKRMSLPAMPLTGGLLVEHSSPTRPTRASFQASSPRGGGGKRVSALLERFESQRGLVIDEET